MSINKSQGFDGKFRQFYKIFIKEAILILQNYEHR